MGAAAAGSAPRRAPRARGRRARARCGRALDAALAALPAKRREGALGARTLRRACRWALDARADAWLQVAWLRLLWRGWPATFQAIAARRLSTPRPGDDLFVRAELVRMAGESLDEVGDGAALLATAEVDPSAFVRQAAARALVRAPREVALAGLEGLEGLARADPAPQVRAAALLGAREVALRDGAPGARALLLAVLRDERDAFVLRVACEVAAEVAARLEADLRQGWCAALAPALEALRRGDAPAPVRAFAAAARERLWLAGAPELRALARSVQARLERAPRGRSLRLPRWAWDEDLLRALAVVAQRDFGYEVAVRGGRARIWRGDRFRARTWRALHELASAAPDKRQDFSHVLGRVYRGDALAPSAILAEQAPTKVPGEPLFIPEEAGWRPFLPLPDMVLSAVDTGRPLRLATAEGTTVVRPPRGVLARLRARAALTLRFAELARLRNATAQDGAAPDAYARALARLGVTMELHPHPGAGAPTSQVARFLAAGAPLALGETWHRLAEYGAALHGNDVRELGAFLALAGALFVADHLRATRRLRAARRAIPLVLGGWGTRGKSGTERLKAALVNALGLPLASKTTGCEAMLVHGRAMGRLDEIFLYRPYDKATIWEQAGVTRLAAGLGADVMLWECMALNPTHVRLLQREWMRDDLSTITNTYPDHEDMQGPAGWNIPDVMTQFVPARATLVTSEEQMLPILADAARPLGTRLLPVTWLDAGLLTDDVLARFPYAEHPCNVALALRVAEELGLERAFALKEMADRVVPDLGVLKAFPAATVRRRRLELVNGMSANERFGALSSWQRMGFDRHDPEREPGVFVTIVVNNRADRVPRSRVFASMLVNDVAADRHVLIGSNLQGLLGFVRAAWDEHARALTLWPPGGDPVAALTAGARRLRLPHAPGMVRDLLAAMLRGIGARVDVEAVAERWREPAEVAAALRGEPAEVVADVLAHLASAAQAQRELAALRAKVERAPGPDRALDGEYRALAWRWFQRKLVVVSDPEVPGDEVVRVLAEATPPGLLNRVMAMQNIKGPGLDLVQRWIDWERCRALCLAARRAVRADDPALAALAAFTGHGRLAEELVRETVAALRSEPWASAEEARRLLDAIEAAAERGSARVGSTAAGTVERAPLAGQLLAPLKGLLDLGRSVRRRHRADLVYRDLAAGRISSRRAGEELLALTKGA